MHAAPKREHETHVFGTLLSYDMFMFPLRFPYYFSLRFGIVLENHFGWCSGVLDVTNMSSNNDGEIGTEKKKVPRTSNCERDSWAGGLEAPLRVDGSSPPPGSPNPVSDLFFLSFRLSSLPLLFLRSPSRHFCAQGRPEGNPSTFKFRPFGVPAWLLFSICLKKP